MNLQIDKLMAAKFWSTKLTVHSIEFICTAEGQRKPTSEASMKGNKIDNILRKKTSLACKNEHDRIKVLPLAMSISHPASAWQLSIRQMVSGARNRTVGLS